MHLTNTVFWPHSPISIENAIRDGQPNWLLWRVFIPKLIVLLQLHLQIEPTSNKHFGSIIIWSVTCMKWSIYLFLPIIDIRIQKTRWHKIISKSRGILNRHKECHSVLSLCASEPAVFSPRTWRITNLSPCCKVAFHLAIYSTRFCKEYLLRSQ